tara:strand:- start:58 stop:627 length:570 start_codon:yes stop_codon:yes gene_type:complete
MATEPNVDDTITTIIVDSMKMLKEERPSPTILNTIENRRKHLGHDASEFNRIMNLAGEFGAAISFPIYCRYRVKLEHPGALSDEEVGEKITSTFKDGEYGYAALERLQQPGYLKRGFSAIMDAVEALFEAIGAVIAFVIFWGVAIFIIKYWDQVKPVVVRIIEVAVAILIGAVGLLWQLVVWVFGLVFG